MTFPVLPSNTSGCYIPTGKKLTNSLRFRASASAYLNRTPSVAGNQQTWTWSGWIKRGVLGAQTYIFGSNPLPGATYIRFESDDTLTFYSYNGGYLFQLSTTQVFRDPSAWYNFTFVLDTTNATATNRAKVYVNGSQITAFSTASYPSLNASFDVNSAGIHTIMAYSIPPAVNFTDGYLSEVNFIDGQALSPTSFGQFDPVTGVWVPINYTGTYGTNGFYLPFTDTTSATTLAYDQSGNGNNWTPNNISTTAGSTYDAMTDVPTLTNTVDANYCVLNAVGGIPQNGTGTSNGNLTANTDSGYPGTIGVTSGKWYWEAYYVSSSVPGYLQVGIFNVNNTYTSASNRGNGSGSYVYNANSGNKSNNGSTTAYGSSYSAGDTIGVALDLDAGTITFYKNNVSQGVAWSGLSGNFAPEIGSSGQVSTFNANFGQQPFAYTPPAGFLPLNTFNLPCPTIWNGATVMAATLYTGNGSTQTISNAANNPAGKTFYPDLTWIKDRTSAQNNVLTDSVRGATNQLISNSNGAATTNANGLTAFSGTGFSVGNDAQYNNNTDALVAWQWNAGNGVTSTNTNGTLTSTTCVNPTAGFSIVNFTGNGVSGATVGHGLGVTPNMVIIRNATAANSFWLVEHSSISGSILANSSTLTLAPMNCLLLNTTSATIGYTFDYQINGSADSMLAYCWAAIPGYSAFGSYTGNGSTNGPFIYTGFRPRFVMTKRTDSTGDWRIMDSSRDPYNTEISVLFPDLSIAEQYYVAGQGLAALSNGFQIMNTSADTNANGGTYIYAAFAEVPFKFAGAR